MSRAPKVPDGAIVMPDGEWVVMAEPTARDFRTIKRLNGRDDLSPDEVDSLFDIVERRAVRASYGDALEKPLLWVIELMHRWLQGEEEAVLPPENAGS